MYDLLKLNQEDLNKYTHNKKCHSDSLKKKKVIISQQWKSQD